MNGAEIYDQCKRGYDQSTAAEELEGLAAVMKMLAIDTCDSKDSKGADVNIDSSGYQSGVGWQQSSIGCEQIAISANIVSKTFSILNCFFQDLVNQSTTTVEAGQFIEIKQGALCLIECGAGGFVVNQNAKILSASVQATAAEVTSEITADLATMMTTVMENSLEEIRGAMGEIPGGQKALSIALPKIDSEYKQVVEQKVKNILANAFEQSQNIKFTCGVDAETAQVFSNTHVEHGVDIIGWGGKITGDRCVFAQDSQITLMNQQIINAALSSALDIKEVNEFFATLTNSLKRESTGLLDFLNLLFLLPFLILGGLVLMVFMGGKSITKQKWFMPVAVLLTGVLGFWIIYNITNKDEDST